MSAGKETGNGLLVVTLRGGDAGLLRSEDAVWLDLDYYGDTWAALVVSEAAAEVVANNSGAEIESIEWWDGEPFGDRASGTVESPRPGVLDARSAHGYVTVPDGWRLLDDETGTEVAS